MIYMRGRMLFTVAAAVLFLGCPAPDAEREEVAEQPDAAAVDESPDPAVEPAPVTAWMAELSGAQQGTFQGDIVTQDDAPGGMALRLESGPDADRPITMMVLVSDVAPGATGSFEAENASVMIGTDAYFHVPDEPTQFRVEIHEHQDGRIAGGFSGTLRPDGPGEPLELEGTFEAGEAPEL